MADDRSTKEPPAAWLAVIGRQAWRSYMQYSALDGIDTANDVAAAVKLGDDLRDLARLRDVLIRADMSVEDVHEKLARARREVAELREQVDRLRDVQDVIERQRDDARRRCESAEDEERRIYELHRRLTDANDRPSLTRLRLWIERRIVPTESYTSWLGLVK